MRLELDDDRVAVRDAFAALFAKAATPERVRAAEPTGFDADLWARLCDIDAPGMAVPEDVGGSGAGLLDAAIACEQLGRTIAPAPLVDTTVATRALARLGVDVTDCVRGAAIATLAPRSAIAGVARRVPGGAIADLVLARDGDQLVLARPGAAAELLPNLGRLPIADIDLADAAILAAGDDAAHAHARAVDEWCVLTAAALVGCGAGAIALTVPYVKGRKAFGVPLATFQAVAHGLADADTDVEGARILMQKAAWAIDADDPQAHRLARMAFFFATGAAERATAAALHFHGGYGVMLEYDIHLFARTAKAWSLQWGGRNTCLDDVADAMLDTTKNRTA